MQLSVADLNETFEPRALHVGLLSTDPYIIRIRVYTLVYTLYKRNQAVVYAFSDSTRKAYTAAVGQAGNLIFPAENPSLESLVGPKGANTCRARRQVGEIHALLLRTLLAVPLRAVQTGRSIMICS